MNATIMPRHTIMHGMGHMKQRKRKLHNENKLNIFQALQVHFQIIDAIIRIGLEIILMVFVI